MTNSVLRFQTNRRSRPCHPERGAVTLLGMATLVFVSMSFVHVALNRADDSRRHARLALERARLQTAVEGARAVLQAKAWPADNAPLRISTFVATRLPERNIIQFTPDPEAGTETPRFLSQRAFTILPPSTPNRVYDLQEVIP